MNKRLKRKTTPKEENELNPIWMVAMAVAFFAIPPLGGLVEDALLHFGGKRYQMIEWVVMPNHVHTLVEIHPDFLLPDVLQSWKSFTAHEANRILDKSGKFWEEEYFDRYIRDAKHFENAVRYIRENPVTAGLVVKAEDWEFSSASWKRRYPGSVRVPLAYGS